MIFGSGASRCVVMSVMGILRSRSVTLRCERSEPRRATAGAVHPSRAAARPPQDDGERRMYANRLQIQVENQMAFGLEAIRLAQRDGGGEERAGEGEAVLFAALAADVDAGGLQLVEELRGEFTAEPFRAAA